MNTDIEALKEDHRKLVVKCKDLRNDLDKDVAQISDNRKRIRVLEETVGERQSKGPKSGSSQQGAVAPSARAISTAPSSPGVASTAKVHTDATVQDPRLRPAPQPSSTSHASVSTPTSASDNHCATTTNHAEASTRGQSLENYVTRSMLAHFSRNFEKDLELRLDEIKDLAVQEATAERFAVTEEQLRQLVRKWKQRAEIGGLELSDQARENSQGPATNTAGASSAQAAALEPTPMDVEPAQPSTHQSDNNTAMEAAQAGLAAAARSQPGSDVAQGVNESAIRRNPPQQHSSPIAQNRPARPRQHQPLPSTDHLQHRLMSQQ